MKHVVLALAMTLATLPAFANGETRQVCVDVKKDGKEVKDPKTGKTKQSCKEVKVHKKLEGTPVPEKK
jgi:hypothetical protein